MKVLLIDIDSTIPNLALKKIEHYHLDRGDEVLWNYELYANIVDKIYVSCVFTWNREKAEYWEMYPHAVIGGTGYSVEKKLPTEIENIKPRINMGFCSRGCVRSCEFCCVRAKEGPIAAVGDIYDIWDGKSKEIELLDNNIMGLPKHFEKIWGQIRKEKLKVKENGLDIRLLDKHKAEILASVSHYEYHFAYDNVKDWESVKRGVKLLKDAGINRSIFYVIIGFETTFKEDMERLNNLKSIGQQAFVQAFKSNDCADKAPKDKRYIPIARWANAHMFFKNTTWAEFMKRPENARYVKYFKKDEIQ